MINIAILASGNGSNAEKIIQYFNEDENIQIALIGTNHKDAFVLTRAKNHNIPSIIFDRQKLYESTGLLDDLENYQIDFIVLAGFMMLVPQYLIAAYPDKIVNIHPALLPKYGGKGMYGGHVHEAVKAANELETGITIHYVNEAYDEGAIIHQAKCSIDINDTPDDIAQKVHQLEYEYYPKVIKQVVSKSFKIL